MSAPGDADRGPGAAGDARNRDAAAHDETRAVAERYARRDVGDRYHPLRPEIWQTRHDRERALIALLTAHAPRPLESLDVIEVGCGHGDNLLELLRLGADPARLVGNELLPDRVAAARARLPAAVRIVAGDATAHDPGDAAYDVVYVSTVFSSILDDDFQRRLAGAMWRWVRPGGAVLWYDFTIDNPRNTDVRAMPTSRVRALFPDAVVHARRVTLAPPIGRHVVRLHPALWRAFNALPLLRTHWLAWLAKPAAGGESTARR